MFIIKSLKIPRFSSPQHIALILQFSSSKTTEASRFDNKRWEKSKFQKNLKQMARTNQWQEVIEIIEKEKIICTKPTLPIFNSLVVNAFKQFDEKKGWKMLNVIAGSNLTPNQDVFHAYWEFCAQNQSIFHCRVEKMLEFIVQQQIRLSQSALDGLDQKLKCFGGAIVGTNIDSDGNCEKCSAQLKIAELSLLEFRTLKNEFEKTVAQKMLDPKEIYIFRQLVNKNSTFDYFIDSMNVSRIATENDGNILQQGNTLIKVIEHLRKQKKRIFVVGQRYVNKWPEHIIEYLHRNTSLFLTNSNLDDIFILYGALISGPTSHFVSNDRMKEYPKYLKDDTQDVFRRWQIQRQLTLSNHNGIEVRKSQQYNRLKISSTNRWHIPYIKSLTSLNSPCEWACINVNGE